MASMKTLGRQRSTNSFRSKTPLAAALCFAALALPACLLQPKEAPSATAANNAAKKKALAAERWQAVGGGMLGVSADQKGSKGNWSLDDGPKPGQRALLIEYDL